MRGSYSSSSSAGSYSWLEPFWSQCVGMVAVTLLAFRIRSFVAQAGSGRDHEEP